MLVAEAIEAILRIIKKQKNDSGLPAAAEAADPACDELK
jgi:hypothetical protein